MRKLNTSNTIFLILAGLMFIIPIACTEENSEVELSEQEQRYFDLYLTYSFQDTTAVGLDFYYVEESAGEGASPGENDWVFVNYVGYVIPEDRVVDTYIEHVADDHGLDPSDVALFGRYKMHLGSQTEGLQRGLSMMKEKGEATFCYTSDLAYGADGITLMGSVGSYASMKYEVQLLDVIRDIQAYEAQNIALYVDTISGVQRVTDPETDVTMYYVIDVPTDSTEVNNDTIVHIAYKGYLMDGRVFDESTGNTTYEFIVGDYEDSSSPIVGWHLGVEQFRMGEKGRLIIPWQLAYGEEGRTSGAYVTIPSYENLVFDIEVVRTGQETGKEVEAPNK